MKASFTLSLDDVLEIPVKKRGLFAPLRALSDVKAKRDKPYTALDDDALKRWQHAGVPSVKCTMYGDVTVVVLSMKDIGFLTRAELAHG